MGGSNAGGSSGAGGSTAGPAGPAGAAGPAAPGRRGGIALDFRRGRSAKKLLQVEWTYPVWKPKDVEAKPGVNTVSVETEHALPLAEAYEWVTEGDRRPLLILRECDRCKGTDHALLSRTLDNEQTVLLTHWFRCVKLPTNVLDEKHPFTNLFQRQKPGERIPHLFFSDPDGQNRDELPGDQPQAQLWAAMFERLERCYRGNAKKALKDLRGLLSQLDRVDAAEDEVMARLDNELDKNGEKSAKVAKYRADLKKLEKERAELKDKELKLRNLALKDLAEDAPAAPAADGVPAAVGDGASAR